MRFIKQFVFLIFCLAIISQFTFANSYVMGIESLGNGDYLIVVPHQVDYKVFELPNPERLVIDLKGAVTQRSINLDINDSAVQRVRCAQHSTDPVNVSRVVFDLETSSAYNVSQDDRGIMISFPKMAQSDPVITPVIDRFVDVELSNSAEELPRIRLAQNRDRTPPPITLTQPTEELMDGDMDQYTGEPITLDLKDVDVTDVLTILAEIGERNIVIHPDVSGRITLRISDIPWDAIFDLVLKNSDLGMEDHAGIIRVARVDKLTREKAEAAELLKQKALAAPLETEIIQINYARAQEVARIFENFKSDKDGAEIIVDNRTNIVVVRDIREYIDQMKSLIGELDRDVPQVIIEARIVETTSDFARMFGVNLASGFSASPVFGNTTSYEFPYTYDTFFNPGIVERGIFGIDMTDITGALNINMMIDALETIGGGKQVSSPRVIVQNNSVGMIRHGQDRSRISERTDQDGNIVQSTTSVSAYTLINVRPTITPDRKILIDVQVDKDNLRGATVEETLIDRNNVRSSIVVGDGETVVIGGLFQTSENISENTIPILGHIPLIRHLFRSEFVETRTNELLIFITPTIHESY